jgi:hypothetical protein
MTLPLPVAPRTELLWWGALLIQAAAIPGTLLPVLPGLALLPLGALLWVWPWASPPVGRCWPWRR